MSDQFDLQRFIDAQEPLYGRVRAELADGRKRTHWMWFVFPQIAGLGQSFMARKFAISGFDEARAYLLHPTLGARLLECARLVASHAGRSATEIMGSPDDMKLRSCMTLFRQACPEEPIFQQVLDTFYAGKADESTLARLP